MTKNRFRSFLKVRKLSKKIASIQTKNKPLKKEQKKEESKKLEEKLQPEELKKEESHEEIRDEIIVDLQKKEYDILKPLKEKTLKKEGELEELVSDAPAPEKKESEKEFRGYETKKVGYDIQHNLYGMQESPEKEEERKLYEHRGVVNEPTALYETSLRDQYKSSNERDITEESRELYSDITRQKKKKGIL